MKIYLDTSIISALLDNRNPERKALTEDAYHIAAAVIGDMDILLSWNFRHIVRNKTRDVVQMVNTMENMKKIEIMTPGELL